MNSKVQFAFVSLITYLLLILILPNTFQAANSQDSNLVDVKEIIPSIQTDTRYYTDYNFVGEKIDGYNAPKCLLTPEAAQALLKVQEELLQQSYSLKVYDCYRPQRAVDHFVRWAKDLDDIAMKSEFYPNVDKQNLFADGYIADQSGHSRASTVDLTIVPVPTSQEDSQPNTDDSLDMGTPFDFFDPSSHTVTDEISTSQQQNRLLLKKVMEKHGFENYSREWWHYTLEDEPFPDTYFDVPID